jgi:hypothetical protein
MLFDSISLVGWLIDRSSFVILKKSVLKPTDRTVYVRMTIATRKVFQCSYIIQIFTQAVKHVFVPHYWCLCRPVWSIILQGKMLLHISVLCPTAMKLVPHLSTRNL